MIPPARKQLLWSASKIITKGGKYMTRRIPAEVFPPGVFLEEELEARNLTQLDFAEILGKFPKDVHNLVKGKVSVTPETALLLADALGTSERYWLNLESEYQAYKARLKRTLEDPNRSTEVSLKAKLYEKFPVREMIKRGWIENSSNLDVLLTRFCQFFEIPNLDTELSFGHAARKSGRYGSTSQLQSTWLFRARQLARKIMLQAKFSLAKLKAALNKLRLFLHETAEIRHIPGILAEAGIRFVIIETMPGTKIDGATFWLDNDSPVVVLSLLRDRIDNFWFTLMHELSHVEHGEGKDAPIIDMDLCSKEQLPDRPDYEIRADLDAAEFCVSQDAMENFIVRTDPYYHEVKILGFALTHMVHPGIVVGQLQHRGRIGWDKHRKFLDKVRQIITEPAITDGFGYSQSA